MNPGGGGPVVVIWSHFSVAGSNTSTTVGGWVSQGPVMRPPYMKIFPLTKAEQWPHRASGSEWFEDGGWMAAISYREEYTVSLHSYTPHYTIMMSPLNSELLYTHPHLNVPWLWQYSLMRCTSGHCIGSMYSTGTGEEVWYWGEGLNVKQDHFINNQAVNFVTSCHETTKHSEVLIILVRLKLQAFGHLIEASPRKLEATVLFWVTASKSQFKRQNKLMTCSRNKQVYFYHVHHHKLMTVSLKCSLPSEIPSQDIAWANRHVQKFIQSGGFICSHKRGYG